MEMPSVVLLILEETCTHLDVNRILLSGLVQAMPTVASARRIQVSPRSPQLTLRTDPYVSWLFLLNDLKQSPLSLDSGQIPVLLGESFRQPSHLAQLLRQATIWIGIDLTDQAVSLVAYHKQGRSLGKHPRQPPQRPRKMPHRIERGLRSLSAQPSQDSATVGHFLAEDFSGDWSQGALVVRRWRD